MAETRIEWTDVTWNPTTGCDRVSPGCDHCYALSMARRLRAMGSEKYQRDGDPRTSGPGFGVTEHPDVLLQPFSWKKPKRVFTNSMSDLFHKDVSDAFIARVFAVMALAEQHTFQVLTKRHARMRSLLNDEDFRREVDFEAVALAEDDAHPYRRLERWPGGWWPLSNVWLGVSVENQQWADIRIPALLDTPAAVRFLSCEPLLGSVDISPWLNSWHRSTMHRGQPEHIEWVIAGGESGRGARPMHPDWVRMLRDQCVASGVPFLFKQWGEFRPTNGQAGSHRVLLDGTHYYSSGGCVLSGEELVDRAGKKANGRMLDGRIWDEFPEVVR